MRNETPTYFRQIDSFPTQTWANYLGATDASLVVWTLRLRIVSRWFIERCAVWFYSRQKNAYGHLSFVFLSSWIFLPRNKHTHARASARLLARPMPERLLNLLLKILCQAIDRPSGRLAKRPSIHPSAVTSGQRNHGGSFCFQNFVMKFVRGDVVLRSVPYAVVVDEELFKEICSACMRASSELLVCSKCRHLRYCSQQCQVSSLQNASFDVPVRARFRLSLTIFANFSISFRREFMFRHSYPRNPYSYGDIVF